MRAPAASPPSGAAGAAENMLTGALKSLFAVAEAYPDLKANQNFLMLQQELANIENKIAYSRQHYNDVVRGYNTLQQQFPQPRGRHGIAARRVLQGGSGRGARGPKVSFS
jgi:LemA protein